MKWPDGVCGDIVFSLAVSWVGYCLLLDCLMLVHVCLDTGYWLMMRRYSVIFLFFFFSFFVCWCINTLYLYVHFPIHRFTQIHKDIHFSHSLGFVYESSVEQTASTSNDSIQIISSVAFLYWYNFNLPSWQLWNICSLKYLVIK